MVIFLNDQELKETKQRVSNVIADTLNTTGMTPRGLRDALDQLVSHQAIYNWLNMASLPEVKTLREIETAYPDDWRCAFARNCMAAISPELLRRS